MPEPSTTFSSTGENACAIEVVTQTQTLTDMVTVTLWPTISSAAEDQTVTDNPSTVTDVNTETAYTSGAADVIVSGEPSTVTDLKTELTGYPVLTVSVTPSTVTEVDASYWITFTTTPDAGSFVTVTTIEVTTKVTSATTVTSVTPITTITVSDLYPPLYPPAEGEGESGIAGPPYPTNGTITALPSDGAVTYAPTPTITPIVDSGAENGNAVNYLGSKLALAAAVMYML
jgi:hypothetical protein